MALYVGNSSSVAKKVKKLYVGVNGVARKVKKLYVGVAGIARKVFGGGILSYYGTAASLTRGKYEMGALSFSDYALFAGGEYYTSKSYYRVNTIDAYSAELTRTNPATLSKSCREPRPAKVGNYALFGQGVSGSTYYTTVDAFNMSFSRTSATSLSTKQMGTSTQIESYALFGTGYNSSSAVVNAYDASLTQTIPTNLTTSSYNSKANSIGGKGFFAGGYRNGTTYSNVDVYDSSLNKTSATQLSVARSELCSATVGDYLLFAGGTGSSEGSTVVDVYNSSLTKSIATDLSFIRRNCATASFEDYALFLSRKSDNSTHPCETYADVYDSSLVKTTLNVHSETATSYAQAIYDANAAIVGQYALFAGGGTYSGPFSTVDVVICD